MSRFALALTFLLGITDASAQVCGLESSPVLRFSPQPATTENVVTITAGSITLLPATWHASATDNHIDVVIAGSMKPASYPIVCVRVDVGPLDAGRYTVNLIQDLAVGGGSVSVIKTATLDVLHADEPIPALTPLSLSIAAFLVGVAGIVARGRFDAHADANSLE